VIRKDTAVSAVARSGRLPTRALWTSVDAVIWVTALYLAAWLRLEFSITPEYWYPLLVASGLVVFCHVSIGWLRGPYGIGYDLASFEETSDLAGTAVLSGVTLGFLVVAVKAIDLPRSVPFTGLAMAMAGMFAARFLIRSRRTHRAIAASSERRAVVFGAGAGGRILVQSLVRGPGSSLLPVALLDDDPRKARLFIEGVRVRGTRADLARVAERHQANTVVIAAPSATPDVVRELSEVARDCGLGILVLPPFREILDGRPTESDLRNLDVADLLGRQPVDLDMSAITNEISGRRVLVTGAGGSIGSELCRQLMRFGPDRLHMLDRDESGLHSTQLSLDGRALLDADELVLCDIRDAEAVTRAFRQARPDVVFHAAALKHLTMLERHPDEAFKTNVVGTLNVLDAARCVGVQTFVNISTDKAAGPTCVLGWSKRVAERLTAGYDGSGGGRYVSVRFGNVLGSRGSVVPVFMEQIRRGGPVTVTHPEVERYFMLIPEACQLVLQAGVIGTGGEVMVLDMGTPVRIVDVARTMIGLSGRTDVDIVFTGLRRGEKVTEELFTPGELVLTSTHPLISHVSVPPLDAGRLLDGARAQDERALRDWFTAHGGQRLVRAVS
jgi:FlaA1/EpsC-like NDP-sugar epimerase